MKSLLKKLSIGLSVVIMLLLFSMPVMAANTNNSVNTVSDAAADTAETEADNGTRAKAYAAALAIGVTAAAGAVSMGMAISKSVEGVSRQPEAEGKIRTMLMLGLVFVETAIIYALIVAILIIFVL